MSEEQTTIKVLVDPDEFTIGDMLDIEEITGRSMGEFGSTDKDGNTTASARTILAMAFVAARKTDPDLTQDDVRNWRMDEIEFAEGDEEDDNTDPS